MKSETRARAAAVAALTLALSGGLVAGCGGDSDGGGPWNAYLGRWFQVAPDPVNDPLGSGFTLTCPDTRFSGLAGPQAIWGSIIFEHGTLTDLAETSGNCSLLNYNVSGKTATLPNPDPYLTDDPAVPDDTVPFCVIPFSVSDTTTGMALQAFFILFPNDGMWSFQLLDQPTAEGAPQARLVGSAVGHIIVEDGTESSPDCTYAGMDTYFRLTQP